MMKIKKRFGVSQSSENVEISSMGHYLGLFQTQRLTFIDTHQQ